jgi:hypothetical protein
MQPTYLPWLGYLAMIDRVDRFVFLDNVQFERRSWQQRNRIKTTSGEVMLTIPVRSKGRRDQRIDKVWIDEAQDFPTRHIRSIQHAYAKAPFYDRFAPELFERLRTPTSLLADVTISVIGWLLRQYSIDTDCVRGSTLSAAGAKDTLLCNISKQLNADRYLSPPGSANYLDRSNVFRDADIPILYHTYEHPTHDQINGAFQPFMSAIDLLFNCGPDDGLRILRQGVQ